MMSGKNNFFSTNSMTLKNLQYLHVKSYFMIY